MAVELDWGIRHLSTTGRRLDQVQRLSLLIGKLEESLGI